LRLKKLVADLLKDVAGHDFESETKILFEFVRDKIRYQRDSYNLEELADAYRTIFFFRSGDCDDKSIALATLLGLSGKKTRFKVIGKGYDLTKFFHVYLQVYDEKSRKWICLDATNERAAVGWETENYSHSSVFTIYRKW
jgi:transglutaminase-like putative cysteine protease